MLVYACVRRDTRVRMIPALAPSVISGSFCQSWELAEAKARSKGKSWSILPIMLLFTMRRVKASLSPSVTKKSLRVLERLSLRSPSGAC